MTDQIADTMTAETDVEIEHHSDATDEIRRRVAEELATGPDNYPAFQIVHGTLLPSEADNGSDSSSTHVRLAVLVDARSDKDVAAEMAARYVEARLGPAAAGPEPMPSAVTVCLPGTPRMWIYETD